MDLEVCPVHGERGRGPRPGILQATVVIAWMVALAWLALGGGESSLLGRFIRSDYWWLVYAAIGILIAFAASLMIRPSHQPGLGPARKLLQTGILFLPLLYIPLAVTSELSIAAAEKRSMYSPRVVTSRPQTSRPDQLRQEQKIAAVPSKPVTNPVKRGEPTILDLISDPEDFEGANATLVGIVHSDKRLPGDSFYCYRLVMVCCAADATPAGVIVQWPGARKLKKGTWVKVQGKVTFTTFEGGDYPAISAESVEKTNPPKNPFLIPR